MKVETKMFKKGTNIPEEFELLSGAVSGQNANQTDISSSDRKQLSKNKGDD